PHEFSFRVKAVHRVRPRLPPCRLAGLPPRLRVHRIWPGIAVPPGDWKVTAMQALQKPLLKNFARSAEGYAAVTSPSPPRNARSRPYGRGSDSCARLCKHLPSVAAAGIIRCEDADHEVRDRDDPAAHSGPFHGTRQASDRWAGGRTADTVRCCDHTS